MSGKVLGIDLGTSSIGLSVRDTDVEGKVSDQLDFFTSVIFEAGVGVDKTGEFSRAAERRSHRSSRRLNQARRYRIWRTLEVLIEHGYCPLKKEDLERWKTYDKTRDLRREYPIWADHFEKWVRLDFNCDGKPDYTSPYQLREELATHKLDLTDQTERYKLGRALYHIAQRRGFKSSKGETLNEIENENEAEDLDESMKKSELKKCGKLQEYMNQNDCKTAGCAFAKMERDGIRVRANTDFQAVRDLYEKEVRVIFEMQGIDASGEFGRSILSKKKDEGSIFFKRPLRSQKGTVGKCTLERDKSRCPLSRPEFEIFRAWSLINNIRYRTSENGEEKELTLDEKNRLFNAVFTRAKKTFKFEDITKFLKKEKGELYKLNYKDKTVVSGCPVVCKMKALLGEEWETATVKGSSIRQVEKLYNYEELWHKCFEAEDAEEVLEFVNSHLEVADKDDFGKKMVRLWGSMGEGYSNLSLKAINNINRVLREGMIYTDAVLWAKVADIVGESVWESERVVMLDSYEGIKFETEKHRRCAKLANEMIARYKVLSDEERDIYREGDYTLDDNDRKSIREAASEMLTKEGWKRLDDNERNEMLEGAAEQYQQFLRSREKEYVKVPKLTDGIASFLEEQYGKCIKPNYKGKIADALYHPSAIAIYAPQKERNIKYNGVLLSKKLLGSPATDVFKNPMVMRVLHTLRRNINKLILDNKIDEDTRVVVEMARELNDANARWAIETYQREREAENIALRKRMEELFPNRVINEVDIQQCRLLLEQAMLDRDCENLKALQKQVKELKSKDAQYGKDITKYSLWLEQNCISIYTGKPIRLSELFDSNKYDIEHTVPRSLCFDDSLANKTICEADYNRNKKKNRVPSELSDFEAIKMRIQPWIDRRNAMKELIDFWRGESKKAVAGSDRKNQCIRQQHLWKMEFEYWNNKVERFLIERDRVGEGFRNSQLVDTRIISKYAFHFLKTVFSKVEVQRGDMTADFRKAFGIQSVEEKKSRDKHSHHAIDATMLTLIPTNKKRDRMLELFYEIEDKKRINEDTSKQEKEFAVLRKQCNIHGVDEVAEFIENNILIRHDSKDQTLAETRKKIRVRGKIKKDANGKAMYMTGDAIRGRLHKETYFGAIKYPLTDENGEIQLRDGQYVYEKDKEGNEVITMVVRVPLNSLSKYEEIDIIVDPNVRRSVRMTIDKRLVEGMKFADAINGEIYMLDQTGNEVKEDKNGRILRPIRHVRCKVKSGMGFFTMQKALSIRRQTYKSAIPYKNNVYAQNDGNYLCLLYEGEKKGKIKRRMVFVNYFEIAQMGIRSIAELRNKVNYATMVYNGVDYKLKSILKTGTNVLMLDGSVDDIRELNPDQLNKRLFVVFKFNNSGSDYLYLQNAIEARSNDKMTKDGLKGDGETVYDPSRYQHRLKLNADNCNFLIEGVDFEITTKGIEFK